MREINEPAINKIQSCVRMYGEIIKIHPFQKLKMHNYQHNITFRNGHYKLLFNQLRFYRSFCHLYYHHDFTITACTQIIRSLIAR